MTGASERMSMSQPDEKEREIDQIRKRDSQIGKTKDVSNEETIY